MEVLSKIIGIMTIKKIHSPKKAIFDNLKKDLGDKACIVLITCTQPGADGKMEVQLDYEGDETLAAFLVENAAIVFEGQNISRETK